MSAPESNRLALYTGLTDKLGPELADRLMDFLPTTELEDLATKDDIADLARVTRADLVAVRSEMTSEFGAVRSEMTSEFVAVRAEIAQLAASTIARMAEMEARLTRDTSQATNRLLLAVIGGNATVLAGLLVVAFG